MSATRNVSQADTEAEPFRWAPRRVVSKAELLKMYSPTECDDGALTIEKTEKPMSEFKSGDRVLVHPEGACTIACLYTDAWSGWKVERDTAAARLAAIAAGMSPAVLLPAEPWMDQIEASQAWAEAMSKTDLARSSELREWEANRRRMCLAVFGEVKAWKHEAEELLRRDERAGTALRMGELPTMAPSEPESSPLARVVGCGHTENSGMCPNCAKEWTAPRDGHVEMYNCDTGERVMPSQMRVMPLSWNCGTIKHTTGETPDRIISERNYHAGTLDVYDHSRTLVLRVEGLPSDGTEQPLEDAVRAALCEEVLRLRAIISGPTLRRGAQVVCQDDEDP